jgi:hypothetical protein
MSSGDDVAAAISWCEERVLAINEAQMVDASAPKPGAGKEESKPLFARQTELADAVQTLLDKSSSNPQRSSKPRNSRKSKTAGGISQLLISSNSQGILNTDNQVLVTPNSEVDFTNDQQVEMVNARRDQAAELFEMRQLVKKEEGSGAGVHKFLGEALGTRESAETLRKTNLESGMMLGRNAGYGYVLDEFLDRQGLPSKAREAEEASIRDGKPQLSPKTKTKTKKTVKKDEELEEEEEKKED